MWLLVVIEVVYALIWFGGVAGLVLFPLLAWLWWRRGRLRGAVIFGILALICVVVALREVVPPLLEPRRAEAIVAAVTRAGPMPGLSGKTVLHLREAEWRTGGDQGCADLLESGAVVWVGRLPQEIVPGRVMDLRPLISGRAVLGADGCSWDDVAPPPRFDWLIVQGAASAQSFLHLTERYEDWFAIMRLVAPLGDPGAWDFDPAKAPRIELFRQVRSFDPFDPFGTPYTVVPAADSFPGLADLL